MKAVVAAFNQEKALVGAFSVITNLRMELFQALVLAIATKYLGSSFIIQVQFQRKRARYYNQLLVPTFSHCDADIKKIELNQTLVFFTQGSGLRFNLSKLQSAEKCLLLEVRNVILKNHFA